MRIEDYLVQLDQLIDRASDRRMLKSKLFDVNMRLYRNNKGYRKVIKSIIKYMKYVLSLEFDNYTPGRGISGANVGIPFNIIIIRTTSNNKITTYLKEMFTGTYKILINPEIVSTSVGKVRRKSNCGSLRLPEPIPVVRHKAVSVKYYNLRGRKENLLFEGSLAATVQHEVDHNNGILITDRTEKK